MIGKTRDANYTAFVHFKNKKFNVLIPSLGITDIYGETEDKALIKAHQRIGDLLSRCDYLEVDYPKDKSDYSNADAFVKHVINFSVDKYYYCLRNNPMQGSIMIYNHNSTLDIRSDNEFKNIDVLVLIRSVFGVNSIEELRDLFLSHNIKKVRLPVRQEYPNNIIMRDKIRVTTEKHPYERALDINYLKTLIVAHKTL